MRPLILALCSACALLLALAPLVAPTSNAESLSAAGGGKSSITVQIQTRVAPDEKLVWAGGKEKTRNFKLFCETCYLTNPPQTVNITVDFGSGTTPNELAQMIKEAIDNASGCLSECDYSVRAVNNSLVITGIGADHFAGTFDDPVYDGETGEDFYDSGKPKKSPFCRLAIYKN